MADEAYLTIPEIARQIGEPVHRVTYAIMRYDIRPAMRAGIIRLFSMEQLPTIEAALRRTGEASGGRTVFA